jgi:hypothetical protein
MVATATAAAGSTGSYPVPAQQGNGGATVPFFYGSNWYVEKFATDTYQLTTTTQEFVHNINPGGFLRGVRLEVRSTGGVGGTMTADAPWNVFQNITLENIDGAPILFPMNGFAYYVSQALYRPWLGSPATRFDYVNGPNPSLSLFIQPEIRHTACVLANTDARALYRIRFTVNTFANVITSGGTAPTLTITSYMEAWAQPDDKDLHGNMIEGLPVGLNLALVRRHQIFTLNTAGAGNQFQLSNTGNELRGMLFIVRDSNNARQDYLSDPVRVRLDNRSMGTFSPNEIFNQMADFYGDLSSGAYNRPTGVYMWPRFYNPGVMIGQAWEQTTNATYLLYETNTLSTAANLPGTVEVITDEVTPVGTVPAELESI